MQFIHLEKDFGLLWRKDCVDFTTDLHYTLLHKKRSLNWTFFEGSTHLYKRVCPSVRLSVLSSVRLSVMHFFWWVDYERKWSERPRETVWLLPTSFKMSQNVSKCPKMSQRSTSDASSLHPSIPSWGHHTALSIDIAGSHYHASLAKLSMVTLSINTHTHTHTHINIGCHVMTWRVF